VSCFIRAPRNPSALFFKVPTVTTGAYMKGNTCFRRDLQRLWENRPEPKEFAPLFRMRIFFHARGIHWLTAYRLKRATHYLYQSNKPLWFIPYLFVSIAYVLACIHYGINIESPQDLGAGLSIDNPSCIFIGGVIGEDCTIHQCTTIGYGYSKGKAGIPRIGDNVWIGPGVVISGKISIGSHSTILGGSIVTDDIPEGALAMGNPCRVVMPSFDNTSLRRKTETRS
jgi:serine acetyltransferase